MKLYRLTTLEKEDIKEPPQNQYYSFFEGVI